MLVREEAGSAGASCKTFLPGTVFGTSAEEAAETLEAGDVVRGRGYALVATLA
jgi:hypothetical protein